MTSKRALVELIIEAESVNANEKRISFLRNEIEKDLDRLEKLDALLGDNVLGDANTGLEILETLIARADKYKQRCKDLQEIIDVIKTCEFDDVYAVNKKWLDKVLEELE